MTFWDSSAESDMIDRTPTESGAGVHVDKDGWERLGAYACGVSRLFAAARTEGRGRPPFPRGAPFLHRRERSLARSAGALRSLEQRMEALRPPEQGRRLRGLLRHARGHEFDGAYPSDVRLHRRARSCVGRWRKGGQERQALGRSRGGFTTKIQAKSDASGDIIAFDLTGGEAFDTRHFETLLDIGPDIQPRAVISRQRLRQQGEPGRRKGPRHRSRHSLQGQRKEQTCFLRPHPLQGPRPHRARRRKAQALQARRSTMRKDSPKLRSIVSFAAGLYLIKFVHTT